MTKESPPSQAKKGKKKYLSFQKKIIFFFILAFLLSEGIYFSIQYYLSTNDYLIHLKESLDLIADTMQKKLLKNSIYQEETVTQLSSYGIINIHPLTKKSTSPIISENEKFITYQGKDIEIILTKHWAESLKQQYNKQLWVSFIKQMSISFLLLFTTFLLLIVWPLQKSYTAIKKILKYPSSRSREGQKKLYMMEFLTDLATLTDSWNKKAKQLNSIVQDSFDLGQEIQNIFHHQKEEEIKITTLVTSCKQKIEYIKDTLKNYYDSYFSLVQILKHFHHGNDAYKINIDNLLENTEHIHQSLLQTEALLENYQKEKDKIVLPLQSLVKKTDGLSDTMKQIYSSTENITETINIVKNTVNQISILAMNATIEAAHLGESHQGLSVVANEIQNLAKIVFQNTSIIFEEAHKNKELIYTVSEEYNILQSLAQNVHLTSEKINPYIKDAFAAVKKNPSSQAILYIKEIKAKMREQEKHTQKINTITQSAMKIEHNFLHPELELKKNIADWEKENKFINDQHKMLATYFRELLDVLNKLQEFSAKTKETPLSTPNEKEKTPHTSHTAPLQSPTCKPHTPPQKPI